MQTTTSINVPTNDLPLRKIFRAYYYDPLSDFACLAHQERSVQEALDGFHGLPRFFRTHPKFVGGLNAAIRNLIPTVMMGMVLTTTLMIVFSTPALQGQKWLDPATINSWLVGEFLVLIALFLTCGFCVVMEEEGSVAWRRTPLDDNTLIPTEARVMINRIRHHLPETKFYIHELLPDPMIQCELGHEAYYMSAWIYDSQGRCVSMIEKNGYLVAPRVA